MQTVLAMVWRFNADDMVRFRRLITTIETLYCGVSIVTTPDCDLQLAEYLRTFPKLKLLIGKQMIENRRYLTIQQALAFDQATHIHYCDGDHVLSRMEGFLEDWTHSLQAIQETDCLIIGRSQAAFDSYPRALRETEQIINLVGSHLLGQLVDLGSGSRGFSRQAVEFLIHHASPETHGVATDLEWLVLLARAGFRITTYESEGAIYEIANEDHRQRLESVEQWSKRIDVARIIIRAGIEAANRQDLSRLD
jgi:hypothetical protein